MNYEIDHFQNIIDRIDVQQRGGIAPVSALQATDTSLDARHLLPLNPTAIGGILKELFIYYQLIVCAYWLWRSLLLAQQDWRSGDHHNGELRP